MFEALSQRLLPLLQLTRMALVFTAIADSYATMLLLRHCQGYVARNGQPLEAHRMLAIAAISIDTFTPPAEFKRTVDGFIRDLRNSRRLPGVERIWLPGEQSHTKLLERRAHGVPIPKSLRESLDTLARDLSIAPLE